MRWVVRANDGDTVGEVLARANADSTAVRDGRVFVGRRRVQSDGERVAVGEIVLVAPAPALRPEPIRILAEADGLVAVEKPAGIPTIPDHGGSSGALVALVARQLAIDAATLHPTSRLDRGVSGVVILARGRAARERLAQARADGRYERRYVALAAAAPAAPRGVWDAPIGRAADPRLRSIGGREPVPARTRYAVCAHAPRARSGAGAEGTGGRASPVLLAVEPITGRTHQIRVHAAHAQSPLYGDRSYGGPFRVSLPDGRVVELRRVALHAARIAVPGARGAPFEVRAPLPRELGELWSALGGDERAWEDAVTCAL